MVTATATQLKVDFAYESNESIRIILHDAQKKTQNVHFPWANDQRTIVIIIVIIIIVMITLIR